MNNEIIIALKIIFLLGFTLHNLEEAIWLPEWSKYAEKYHKPVERNEFIFAVIVITTLGYIITLLDIVYGYPGSTINYIFLGFTGMMGLNSIFPHLIATIVLKKYAPGLLTGIFLNLPISLIIIISYLQAGLNIYLFLISTAFVSMLVLYSLKYLFILGGKFIRF